MKTPTEIKDKIRQLKFEYLKANYARYLAQEPQNCIYNSQVVLHDTSESVTRICTYFSTQNNYRVCNTVECAKKCDAFVNKVNKKDLRALLDKNIQENPSHYLEIIALQWVLDANSEPLPAKSSRFKELKYNIYTLYCDFKQAIERIFK